MVLITMRMMLMIIFSPPPLTPPTTSIDPFHRVEELQRLSARRGGGGGSGGGGSGGGPGTGGDKHRNRGRQSRSSHSTSGWEGDDLAHRLALQTMENYARSLRVRR